MPTGDALSRMSMSRVVGAGGRDRDARIGLRNGGGKLARAFDIDVEDPQRRRPLDADRRCDRRSGAAGAEQHHALAGERDAAPAKCFDAAQPVEDVAAPAAVAAAGERVDRADDLRLRAQLVRQRACAQLVRNREHEPAQIAARA